MNWKQHRMDESTELIEEFLQLSAEVGVEGTILFGILLFLYFATGVIMTEFIGLQAPYPFFSLKADPVLLIDGTIVGMFTVQGAGSLLLYHFFVGVNNKSLPSVVLSFIGLGVGGALLQITLPEVLELVTGYVWLCPVSLTV